LSHSQIIDATKTPIIGIIPEEIKILQALSKQVPLTSYAPKNKTSKIYHGIAQQLMGLDAPISFPGRIKRMFSNFISIESE